MQKRDGDKIFHFLLYIVEGTESWDVNSHAFLWGYLSLSFMFLPLIVVLLFRGMISLGVQGPELSLGNVHVRLC